MESTFKYEKSISQTNLYKDTVGYWSDSMDLFEKGKFKESIISFLNYMNPELVKTKGINNNSEFNFPHGSMIINFKITPDYYEITAPFIKVPEKRAVVLLRQIAEINFSTLNQSQIFCKNNELYFYYKAPVSHCYPYKLWDLFYEICINADYYDDMFISQLEAGRTAEPDVKHYSKAELDKAYALYNEILDFGIDGCTEHQGKRWFSLGVDHAFITLMRIDHSLNPQGIINNNIKDYFVYNDNLTEEENLNKLIANLKKLKALDRKVFDDSMYRTSFLIPIKRRAEQEYVQNILKEDQENCKETMANSNFMSVTYTLLFKFYQIMYDNNIPSNIEKIIISALNDVSGKRFNDAAKILMNALEKILNLK
jgi:hypothetical protein